MKPGHTPKGHKARKRFGQNFLIDPWMISQIIQSVSPTTRDNLIEIGPGQGALTGPLLELCPNLHVIEFDRDLIPVLSAQFAKYREFKIHQADALKFDFSSRVTSNSGLLRVIGNLPYNISTPLIFHLLTQKTYIHDMHFMLQKEVVNRLAADPGDKNYGRLSIMTQYHCHVEHLFDVPPESFKPAPKVNSAMIRLTPLVSPTIVAQNIGNFDRFVKTAFQQRRKTLRNCLKTLVSDKQANEVGMDLSQRAENLSVLRYIELCNALWGEKDIPD